MKFARAIAFASLLALTPGCGSANLGAIPAKSGDAQVAQAFTAGTATVAVDLFGASKTQLNQLTKVGMDLWVHSADNSGTVERVRGTINARCWSLIQKWGLHVVKLNTIHGLNAFDPKYFTYEKAMKDIQALAAAHPDFCKIVELGKSFEGRPLLALKIGNGDTSKKPAVLFSGENHARELVTSELMMRVAHWMVDNYGKDADATFAVDNRETWITPFVNPDGHVRAEKGQDWRKNADNRFSQNGNYGVDLNRNYDDRNWGSTGTSTNPGDDTFGGPGAFSEPETQAMANLYKSRNFAYLITWHSFSNLVMWPWNDSDEEPADKRLPAIGAKLAKLSGYKAEKGSELYFTSGDDTDYCYGKLGFMAFTIEVGGWGDGFDPSYKNMDKFWKENLPIAKYCLKTADNPSAVYGPEAGARGNAQQVATQVSPSGRKLQVVRAVGTNGQAGEPQVTFLN